MLKRLVKEATGGFSSSGEQTSKPRKKTAAPKRKNSLSSGSESARNSSKRKGKAASESDNDARRRREETPTEDESTRRKTKTNDAERRKRASRMKRQPLLDLKVMEVVHSSMRGKKKKRARQELLDALASYDTEDTGVVDGDKFKKCLTKIGMKFKRSDDVDAVVRCFTKGNSTDKQQDNDDDDADANPKKTLVDYAAFMDFACNGRDSEKLSAIADKLRRVIKAYDDKHDRATSIPFNVGTELKKLDKAKRGWIASDRFTDFMADHERPTLRVSAKDIEALTERFEYEYGKGELGFDYMQFARWLQPSLHLNKKELHARVKKLIQSAQDVGGWELDEVFEAMDENGDGHVSAEELKQALVEMGLPLTDAQILCLVEEYDVNGDDKIEYEEFVSLFGAPKTKKNKSTTRDTKRKKESESETDAATDKRKARAKANVRNTFSWAIHKAFARKHAAQGRKASDDEKPSKAKQRKRAVSSSSDDDDAATKTKSKKKKKQESDSESDEASDRPAQSKRTTREKSKRRQQQSDDGEQSESEPARKGRPANKKSSKRKQIESSTESEPDKRRSRSTSRARKSDKRKPRKRDESEDDDEESDKHADRERKKDKKKKERKPPVSTTTEDSTADVNRRRGREHRSASAVSHRSRRGSATTRERAASTARASPRRRKQSLEPQRRHRSVSRTRRRESTTGRARRRRNTRSKSATARQAAEESEEGSGRSVSDSESGLDLDQVRRLQRQPRQRRHKQDARSGQDSLTDDPHSDENEDTDEEETTPSDREYAKRLRKSLRRAFDFFDLDHNDAIDKRELGHVLRALGHEFSSKQLDRDMRRADLDRNNALDFHEFVRFVTKQLSQKAFLLSKQREMEIRRSFQSLDTDKNGCLDEHEFEYLIYKVLQVELSVEEQDALLDFVDANGDGQINEEEFIAFMKTMESFHKQGSLSKTEQRRMMDKLDGASKLACSAMKKLIRGAPMDLDSNLLMFFGVPSNYRPALTSSAICRSLHENSLRHALSFPCPETIVAMAQDPMRVGAKREASGLLSLVRPSDAAADNEEALMVLKQAESWQLHAIVSLKRATGVPKPFDTREEDVVKRCVHVCLYQEQEEVTKRRRRRRNGENTQPSDSIASERGLIVGNVHEIPVHWSPQEEDVWEFSKKTTKEDKYKFLVRTNTVNDRLFLLVEFIVHLRMTSDDALTKKQRRARFKSDGTGQVREMTACWCKIPIRTLLARRVDVYRAPQKLWGGTVDSPIDIEQDEVLRRRTGWRAITNAFKKPSPPAMGIKSAPIETYPDDVQGFVRKMPPLILAPFTALPIIAEYMTAMQGSLWLKSHTTSPTLCEPVLALLPQIIDDHEALSAFRRVFDAEMNGTKTLEDRQKKFQDLVLRMWPSFLDLLGDVPQSLLQDASSASTRRLSLLSPTSGSGQTPLPATGSTNQRPPEQQARSNLLQTTAQGKLRLRDIPVAAAPFHVREVAFERLI